MPRLPRLNKRLMSMVLNADRVFIKTYWTFAPNEPIECEVSRYGRRNDFINSISCSGNGFSCSHGGDMFRVTDDEVCIHENTITFFDFECNGDDEVILILTHN